MRQLAVRGLGLFRACVPQATFYLRLILVIFELPLSQIKKEWKIRHLHLKTALFSLNTVFSIQTFGTEST